MSDEIPSLTADNLARIDRDFLVYLSDADASLGHILHSIRNHRLDLQGDHIQADQIVALSVYLERFLLTIFPIAHTYHAAVARYLQQNIVCSMRQRFIQREVSQRYSEHDIDVAHAKQLHSQYHVSSFSDHDFATMVNDAQANKDEHLLQSYALYATWALLSTEGKFLYRHSFLFNPPIKNNTHQYFIAKNTTDSVRNYLSAIEIRKDFSLSGKPVHDAKLLGEAKYCLHCHKRQKDSCRTGMMIADKKLSGCPLDQRISEMNLLLSEGHVLASLAVAMVDNPMILVTGNRICNDCAKACIFQKQDPVDIPAIETGMMEFILALPWGFEIYNLLARWNPLKQNGFLPLSSNGKRVIIAGMGPAGFSMAYFLLQRGYTVLAVDGLVSYSGINDVARDPIYEYHKEIVREKYRVNGFGGVMEYGITVRWNKYYLRGIRILLERYELFKLIPSVHWGSAITDVEAFQTFGFDAVVLALGAGATKLPKIDHVTAPGVLLASDFLMHLHLTKLKNYDFSSGTLLHWPVVIIGGGLTAIDVATEILPYYISQIKAFKQHYNGWQDKDSQISAEIKQFLEHCDILERYDYQYEAIIALLGPVRMIMKQDVTQARSWQKNHVEVMNALQEGIEIVENFDLENIVLDNAGHVSAIVSSNGKTLVARTVILATGINSNATFAQEQSMVHFVNGSIRMIDEMMAFNTACKPIAVLGDMNPHYSGSVVRAIASAKQGALYIDKALSKEMDGAKQDAACGLACEAGVNISPGTATGTRNNGHIDKALSRRDAVLLKGEHAFLSAMQAALRISVVDYKQYSFGSLFTLNASFVTEKMRMGHILRMQFSYQGKVHHMPVTVIDVNRDLKLVKIFLLGDIAKKLCTLVALNGAIQVDFMGPLGKSCSVSKHKRVLIITQSRGMYYAKSMMHCGDLLTGSMCIVDDSQMQLQGYYGDDANVHLIRLNFYDNMRLLIDGCHDKFDECIFLGRIPWACSIYQCIHDARQLIDCSFIYQAETSMLCMLNGLCGRCLIGNMEKGYIFSCGHQEIANLHELMKS